MFAHFTATRVRLRAALFIRDIIHARMLIRGRERIAFACARRSMCARSCATMPIGYTHSTCIHVGNARVCVCKCSIMIVVQRTRSVCEVGTGPAGRGSDVHINIHTSFVMNHAYTYCAHTRGDRSSGCNATVGTVGTGACASSR